MNHSHYILMDQFIPFAIIKMNNPNFLESIKKAIE